jgi:Type II secretion system (T2SS), protein G
MLLALLFSALATGGSHSPLHPAGADLFVEIGSPKDAWTARERAPFNKLFADEELKKLYALLEGFQLPVQALGEAALPPALFGEASPFRALQHASFSVSGLDELSSASEMHIGIEGVLDFPDAAVATAALDALDGWKAIARSTNAELPGECLLGEHSCPLRWYQTGAESLARLDTSSSALWLARDGARLYLGSHDCPPERVAARLSGKEPGLPAEAQLFAGCEAMSPSSGLPIYRLWSAVDLHGLLQTPEFAAHAEAAGALLPWVTPLLFPSLGAQGVWRVELRGERFVTGSVYKRYPQFESKGIGKGIADASAARFVPKEAVGAWITNVDPAALEGEARAILAGVLGKDAADAGARVKELPLLAAGLGTHAAFYMLPINSVQALLPRAFLAVELKDKAQFESALGAWARKLAEIDPAARIVDKPYRKLACVSIAHGKEADEQPTPSANPLGAMAPDMSFSPTIVVFEDRVLFGIKKTYVQAETRRIADGKSSEPHALANAESFPKDVFEVSSMDWGGLFGKLLDIAKGLAPLASGMMGENAPKIDASALPGSATLARFFKPSTSWSKRLPDGRIYTWAESSFGPETPLQMLCFLSAAGPVMKERVQPPAAAAPAPAISEPSVDKAALETQSALLLVKSGLAIYKIENSKLPAQLDELLAPSDRYPGGYLAPQKSVPKDGWGRALVYKCEAGSTRFQLYSCGADGKDDLGAGDDVRAP